MVFIDASDATAADEARAPYTGRLKWDFRFTDSGCARKDLVGQCFTFNCPAAPGDLRLLRVTATDSYAHNAIVCQAAVHAGKITIEQGGIVDVQLDPGVKRLVVSQYRAVGFENAWRTPGRLPAKRPPSSAVFHIAAI